MFCFCSLYECLNVGSWMLLCVIQVRCFGCTVHWRKVQRWRATPPGFLEMIVLRRKLNSLDEPQTVQSLLKCLDRIDLTAPLHILQGGASLLDSHCKVWPDTRDWAKSPGVWFVYYFPWFWSQFFLSCNAVVSIVCIWHYSYVKLIKSSSQRVSLVTQFAPAVKH